MVSNMPVNNFSNLLNRLFQNVTISFNEWSQINQVKTETEHEKTCASHNGSAMTKLGVMYQYGRGIKKNFAKAKYYYGAPGTAQM